MENVPKDNILVWLPSPMGDAILATPALRAIRKRFDSSKITFFGNSVVCQVLSPSAFADMWLEQDNKNVFATAKTLKQQNFTHVILFKNSFASALACFLARIPVRTGYSREGRGVLLTDRLHPPKLPSGDFKPISMVDYYLAVASWLGADVQDRHIELSVEPKDTEALKAKLPDVFNARGPVVILVPGAAAGPSKCWPAQRFAQTADWLASKYNATVVLSVAPNPAEKQIAKQIVDTTSHKLINLGDTPVGLGELKALYALADLVICNDTGPRHIAIGLNRKVITLVGPNNPEWTDPGYSDELFIKGDAPCAPCDRPVCKQTSHFCMDAITVEMVCSAAGKILDQQKIYAEAATAGPAQFFIDLDYKKGLEKLGLNSFDAVFAFQAGKNLAKENLAEYRSRIEFQLGSPPVTLFLKRYNQPSIRVQLKNWLSAKKQTSCAFAEFDAAQKLSSLGINTPKVVAWGEQSGTFFEKRSFIILEKILNGVSLEHNLPDVFNAPATAENLLLRRRFIEQLAAFIKKFHDTGFRHRDLYLCHIFRTTDNLFYLIDLARVFRPTLFQTRYLIKDIAQIHYSAPSKHFSKTDRLRFFLAYLGHRKLNSGDKTLVRQINNKAKQMARHDTKHGRVVPFEP